MALSLGIGAYVFARSRAETHLAFAQRAQRLEARVSEKLSSSLENLKTLQSFLESSDVARLQFRLLAYPMLARNREVYSFEWLPVVHEKDRRQYEAEAQAAHLTGYGFWEKNAEGKRVPAGRRGSYVPIHYMEPPSAFALGFDIASDEIRWATAGLARRRGRDRRVAALRPGRGRGPPRDGAAGRRRVRSGLPRRRSGSQEMRIAKLKGFALAIFRVAPLVDKAASEVDASGLGPLAARHGVAQGAAAGRAAAERRGPAAPRRIRAAVPDPVRRPPAGASTCSRCRTRS